MRSSTFALAALLVVSRQGGAIETSVSPEAVDASDALAALTLCEDSEPGLDATIAACERAIQHPDIANDPHAHYLLGVNYIYADDEESAKKKVEELAALGIDGAPGLLLHVMSVMKPEWITKRYVDDVNKFVELVVPDLPDRLPVNEVRTLEDYYAPEIRYMNELLDEMQGHVFQTDKKYSYYGFDQQWAEAKRVEVGAFRFYELMIASPKGADPLTPKINRFERSRTYDAEYLKDNISVNRGLYDGDVKFYDYRITRSVHGDEFTVAAKFKAPE